MRTKRCLYRGNICCIYDYQTATPVLCTSTYPEENANCNTKTEICVSTKEQTSVKIEGQVTKYAEKMGFTEGKQTVYTYIKTGSTDPVCRSDEQCSTPAFVIYKDGTIQPSSVTLPFVASEPTKALTIDGPKPTDTILMLALKSCKPEQVCFMQDETNPQLVTIEGVVKDADPYKIVFSQDQEMEVLIYKKGICDSKACKEPFIVIDGATIITKQVELTGANKKPMTGKILTKELLPDTSSVVDKSDVNGQLTCEQAKLCVKLNKKWTAHEITGSLPETSQRLEMAVGGLTYTVLFHRSASERISQAPAHGTVPKSLGLDATEKVFFIPAEGGILTPKLYFTEPRDGQAQLETPASGSTCVEDNTHVCVKVNNVTQKVTVKGSQITNAFRLVFTYQEKITATKHTVSAYLQKKDIPASCIKNSEKNVKSEALAPCTEPSLITLNGNDIPVVLGSNVDFTHAIGIKLYVNTEQTKDQIDVGANCEKAICIKPKTDISAVSILGKVEKGYEYLEFTEQSPSSSGTPSTAKTIISQSPEASKCSPVPNCTEPGSVDGNSGKIEAATVFLKFKANAIKTTLYKYGFKQLPTAVSQPNGDLVCGKGKQCATPITENTKVQIQGSFTDKNSIEFTFSGTTKVTFFSKGGKGECPELERCTKPPFVDLSGGTVELSPTKLDKVSSKLFVREVYEDPTAFGPLEGGQCKTKICTTFQAIKNVFAIDGKLTTFPLSVFANFSAADVWTFTFNPASTLVAAQQLVFLMTAYFVLA